MSRTITLKVPEDFQIPTFYNNASPERVAFAIRIGAQAIGYFYNTIADEVREECNVEVVEQLEKKHLKRSEQLEREKRILEDNLEHLRQKMKLDEQFQSGIRSQVKEEMQEMYKDLLDEKNSQIHRLQEQMTHEIRTLHDKFQTVKDNFTRQYGSQEKGRVGELSMDDMIKKAFGSAEGFDLQTTAKEAQRGDQLMLYKDIKVMWEIKNYNRMVNKDEVNKLHRDMRSNPDIHIAFMVSLHTGIVGHVKAGDIDLEVLEDGRTIVYINNLYKRDDPVLYLQTLRPFLDLIDCKKEHVLATESEELSRIESRIKIVQYLLITHQKTLTTLHNSIIQQKKKTEQMNAELLALIRQAEVECGNSLKELLQEQARSERDMDESLNPEIYTKTRMLDLTEPQKKLVQWFSENCIQEEDGEIESKKVQEALKSVFKTEKELREAREIIQEAVWPKGGKKVKGFRLL